MLLDLTPTVTGSGKSEALVMKLLRARATGDEYSGVFALSKKSLAGLLGIVVLDAGDAILPLEPAIEESLQSRAAAIARNAPAVETDRPALPQLTGDLLKDVRAVTGLTLDQIARVMRVSGRAVAAWGAGDVPSHREPLLQALRSIGLSLVGGLGPSGVQRWFLAGAPTRLDRLAAGDVERVVAEARAYETSPAT